MSPSGATPPPTAPTVPEGPVVDEVVVVPRPDVIAPRDDGVRHPALVLRRRDRIPEDAGEHLPDTRLTLLASLVTRVRVGDVRGLPALETLHGELRTRHL